MVLCLHQPLTGVLSAENLYLLPWEKWHLPQLTSRTVFVAATVEQVNLPASCDFKTCTIFHRVQTDNLFHITCFVYLVSSLSNPYHHLLTTATSPAESRRYASRPANPSPPKPCLHVNHKTADMNSLV